MARMLLDTCVWGGAVPALVEFKHNIIWTGDWEKDPGDESILEFAHGQERILVTLDKDFGELAIVKGRPHFGIIRLSGFRTFQMAEAIHRLASHYEDELALGAIIAAEPARVRIRLP